MATMTRVGLCSLCDAPATFRCEVTGACHLLLCDACGKDTKRVATAKGYETKWSRIDGNAVALVVVFLLVFLLPGCGKEASEWDPLFILCVVVLTVLVFVGLAPSSWFVWDCGGCGKCDDCDKGARS